MSDIDTCLAIDDPSQQLPTASEQKHYVMNEQEKKKGTLRIHGNNDFKSTSGVSGWLFARRSAGSGLFKADRSL